MDSTKQREFYFLIYLHFNLQTIFLYSGMLIMVPETAMECDNFCSYFTFSHYDYRSTLKSDNITT